MNKKITYSNYFKSYILLESYVNDDCWFFSLCNKQGKHKGKGKYIKAKSKFNDFKWEIIENKEKRNRLFEIKVMIEDFINILSYIKWR